MDNVITMPAVATSEGFSGVDTATGRVDVLRGHGKTLSANEQDFSETVLLGSLGSTVMRLRRAIEIRCRRDQNGVSALWPEANISAAGPDLGSALTAMQAAIIKASSRDFVPAILQQYLA